MIPTRYARAASPLEGPWNSISLDFITRLPRVDGHKAILVIIDYFSKYTIFIPTHTKCKVEEVAELFLQNIVKMWGLPWSIISNRNSRFTEQFCTSLFTLLRT